MITRSISRLPPDLSESQALNASVRSQGGDMREDTGDCVVGYKNGGCEKTRQVNPDFTKYVNDTDDHHKVGIEPRGK